MKTIILSIILFSFIQTISAKTGNDIIADTSQTRYSDPDINRSASEDPVEDAFQRKIFNGLSASSQFGNSVGSAGDVNGDGYDDIIAGAHGYNSFTGRAYIYLGGQNMNTVADITLTGLTAGGFFGYSVSSAGDVNGDGFSDVIASAYAYNSNSGRAYIYFGGASMNNTADVILTGDTVNCYFGISVSSAGDVNSDGYADVVIGANGYNGGKGRSFIYYGGASMNNVADVIMSGEAANNSFGTAVSSAGDINADGYSDVLIGANGYSSNAGRTYIFVGGSSMDNVPDVIMTVAGSNNNFGASVSSAGDMNDDGYDDVIVGAYGISAFTGKTYVYFGGSSMENVADMIMTGEATLGYFGAAVSSAGDLNGDSYSDVIVGAFGMNSNTGKIYVYFGGETIDTVSDICVTGESSNNYFGVSVALSGDVNGDGYPEVIAGAKGYNSFTGRAYYYDYYMRYDIIAELKMTGEATDNFFGTSVSDAGDVNGDGFSDVIAGASGYNSNTGRAYIYFGGINMDNTADVILTGESSNNYFGSDVSSAGDINSDGYDDIIVGASRHNSFTGRAYVFLGGSSMDNTADLIMIGESANSRFGASVSPAGDVNGDGYSDFIVGAYYHNAGAGKAYIFLGGAALDNIPDINLTGITSNNNFGISVSSAGDMNGDGYSDVIAGAYSLGNAGEAFIYFGNAVMNGDHDIRLSGSSNSTFGTSVSSAGDVNGDGYSDIVIGSYNTNTSYIYYGGSIIDNVSDVVMTGAEIGYFGVSVAGAGDVNRDGYSDVIIGDDIQDNPTGKAYIFYGGIDMNNTADVTMTGETGSGFGSSVSSAGDLNGDGYSDIIAGGLYYGGDFGRAYIYTGSAISVKPILVNIKDVPNDQGGYVDLKWARSSYDVNGVDIITGYNVERSDPPSGGNFAWVNIASIPATKNSFYSYISSTPFDSGENTSGTFFFRVTAVTNSPSQYWRSGISSGRSTDNLSPPIVSPFNAFSESANVRLTWKRCSAPDLSNYILFRSTSPSIDPYTESPATSLTDSTYLDQSPLSGTYYYFIVARDIHNNYSPVASVQSPVSDKKLFLFGTIQGLYNSNTNAMIYDSVTVYLRNASAPYQKIDSSRKLLYGPGTGQEFTFANAQNNVPYYIQIKHRNAIETWSADPVTFVSDNSSIAFSVDASYAYGSNQIKVDSDPYNVFAFYSGDVNQDGSINLTDIISVYNNSAGFVAGYSVTDLNGDNITNLSDLIMTYNNSAKFVQVVRP